MCASLQTKHLIRGGVVIFAAWLLVYTVMFTALYGYWPRQTAIAVFMFSSSCAFPYEQFTLPETAKVILTISHWLLSVVLFSILGGRLPVILAFVVALVSIPVLAFVGSGMLRLIGFP